MIRVTWPDLLLMMCLLREAHFYASHRSPLREMCVRTDSMRVLFFWFFFFCSPA
jgi:hypothetical protein